MTIERIAGWVYRHMPLSVAAAMFLCGILLVACKYSDTEAQTLGVHAQEVARPIGPNQQAALNAIGNTNAAAQFAPLASTAASFSANGARTAQAFDAVGVNMIATNRDLIEQVNAVRAEFDRQLKELAARGISPEESEKIATKIREQEDARYKAILLGASVAGGGGLMTVLHTFLSKNLPAAAAKPAAPAAAA